MGLGSFLGKALPIIGTVASAVTGNPMFAMGGQLLGGASGGDKGANSGYAAMNLPNIAVPGVKWPGGDVQMPLYPTLPQATNVPTRGIPLVQKATQGEQQAGKALAVSQLLQLLTLDPNNPITKNLASSETQLADQAFADTLQQTRQASQRNKAQGRASYFNPERRDTDFITAIAKQAATNRLGAVGNARNTLNTVSGNMRNLASGYQQQSSLEQGRLNTYEQQLQERINELRANFELLLGQQRGDITNNVDMQRNDIYKALDLARGLQSTGITQKNQTDQRNANLLAGMGMQANNGASNPLSYLTSLFSGGGGIMPGTYNSTPGAIGGWVQ